MSVPTPPCASLKTPVCPAAPPGPARPPGSPKAHSLLPPLSSPMDTPLPPLEASFSPCHGTVGAGKEAVQAWMLARSLPYPRVTRDLERYSLPLFNGRDSPRAAGVMLGVHHSPLQASWECIHPCSRHGRGGRQESTALPSLLIYWNVGRGRDQLSLIWSHAAGGGHLEEGGGSGDSFLENVLLAWGHLGGGEQVPQRSGRKGQREGTRGGGSAGLVGDAMRIRRTRGARVPPGWGST